MPSNKKLAVLENRNFTLKVVKTYTDEESKSPQYNIYVPWKKVFQETKTTDEILNHLNTNKNKCEEVLSISDEGSFQIHSRGFMVC